MSDENEREYLRKQGRSEEEIDKEVSVRGHNKFLDIAFMSVTGVGIAIAASTTPIHIIQAENWVDWIENSEPIRYYANHVKGAGQAVVYAQMPNLVFATVMRERAEDKHAKETGIHTSEPMKDHSGVFSALLLAGGFAWEKLSEAANPQGGFDSTDMMWYGIGVAALIGANKSIQAFAKHKFPAAYTTPAGP